MPASPPTRGMSREARFSRANGHEQMTGTPNQIEWAEQIKVKAGAEFDPKLRRLSQDLHGAFDAPRWSVERRQEAVAHRFYLSAPELCQGATDDLIVLTTQASPRFIAERGASSR